MLTEDLEYLVSILNKKMEKMLKMEAEAFEEIKMPKNPTLIQMDKFRADIGYRQKISQKVLSVAFREEKLKISNCIAYIQGQITLKKMMGK